MPKAKTKSLESVLKRHLKDEEFRLAYDRQRFYLHIAHLITDLRARSGLSQNAVAKKARVSQPMIARLESGDHRRTPTLETIHKVLGALGYTLTLDVQPIQKVA